MLRLLSCFVLLTLAVCVAPRPAAAVVWTRLGPDGGELDFVAVDPVDPAVAYATAPSSVFKSVDGGTSWHALAFPPRREEHVAIVVDPTAPATVYVAGEFDVYKSTDAGASWTRFGTKLTRISSLALDPAQPQRVWAGGADAVAVSADGGLTWSSTPLPGAYGTTVTAIAVDPATSGTAYVAARNGSGGYGVWKTTDGGAHFQPTGLGTFDIVALAFDPASGALFAGHAGFAVALEKSIDGGATWSPSNTGLVTGFVPGGLVFDATVPGRVYAATGSGTYRSTDGGATWTPETLGLIGAPRAIAASPAASGLLLVATDVGLARSTDAAASWTPVTAGLTVEQTNAVAVDASNPSVLYAGSFDRGISKSTDGGATWTPANAGLVSPTVWQIVIDPAAPATVLAVVGDDLHLVSPTQLARSTDGGGTWTTVLDVDTSLDASAAAFAPSASGVVYAGGGYATPNPVWRSEDHGATWTPTALASGTVVTSIAVDPGDADVAYAGGSVVGENAVVCKTTDGGATWTSAIVVPSPFGQQVRVLAIDPTNTQRLLASVSSDQYYRSTDGGLTWTTAGLFNAGPVVFDATGRAFASITFYGAWVSRTLGAAWSSISGNLAPPTPTAFALVGSTLYAGTAGGSVQRASVGTCTSDAACDDANVCTTDVCNPTAPTADALGCTHVSPGCPAFDCRSAFCDSTRGCLYSQKPDNSVCSDDGTSCTVDTCQAGVCRHTGSPAAVCNTSLAANSAQLAFRQAGARPAQLALKLRRFDATAPVTFGDPFTSGGSDYDVCVFDHSGAGGAPALRLAARAPAGGTCGPRMCWQAHGIGIVYRDRDATPDGLTGLKLTPGAAGKTSLLATGKGPMLLLPPGTLTPGVTVQVKRDDSVGACWQATFDAGIRVNTPTQFKAKGQ